MDTIEKYKTKNLVKEDLLKQREIVIFNDDYNTFKHVIECLVKYCKHESLQAQQCAFIIHHNGKCSVKTGTYEKLLPIVSVLLEKGLSAEIL
jgi:ATP-dependent Clp protease adaptor protein ClpS